MKEQTTLWCFRCDKKPDSACIKCKYLLECESVPTGELEFEDGEIVLETHNGVDHVVVCKDEYVLAESVDMIQLLPVDDNLEIRTFYKPFWKVVKQ